LLWSAGTLAVDTVRSRPAYLVLLVLLNEANSLKHIGDVIDSSFLYCQLSHCVIQVNALLRSFPQELNELLSQLYQSILLPGSLTKNIEGLVVDVTSVPSCLQMISALVTIASHLINLR